MVECLLARAAHPAGFRRVWPAREAWCEPIVLQKVLGVLPAVVVEYLLARADRRLGAADDAYRPQSKRSCSPRSAVGAWLHRSKTGTHATSRPPSPACASRAVCHAPPAPTALSTPRAMSVAEVIPVAVARVEVATVAVARVGVATVAATAAAAVLAVAVVMAEVGLRADWD